MKKKSLLFLTFIIVFLFLSAHSVFALEVKLPGMSDNPTLPEYVAYLFGFGISISGILALISFTIGAVGLIASADSPEAASNAKGRMKSAVLGLILTVASFIILRTINPALTGPALPTLAGLPGVFYDNGQQCPLVNTDTTTFLPSGVTGIKYTCNGNGPNLLVWMFPKPGLEETNGYYNGSFQVLACGGQANISGGSFKMQFETPGIYYYLGPNCSTYASGSITSSEDSINDAFKGYIKSVKIVNDPVNKLYYGVIFHSQAGLANGSACNYPITGSGCYSADSMGNPIITAFADNVFTLNTQAGASGDGVNFFSAPYGWNTGAYAGFANALDNTIGVPFLKLDPKKMCFDYTNVNRPNEYKNKCSGSACGGTNYGCTKDSDCYIGETCNTTTHVCAGENGEKLCSPTACETFQDCPGSIQIKGTYLVALYSKNADNTVYCQTFNENVENLNAQPILKPGSGDLDSVYIIPKK